MNNINLHSHIIIIIIIQFNHLITIIISFTNYFQSQWIRSLSPFVTLPLIINPKISLPRPCFRLCCNLPMWAELSSHLTTIAISSLLSTVACWRRRGRRPTTPNCEWGLIGHNHLPWNTPFNLSLRCSSLLNLVVEVGWKIPYLSGPTMRNNGGLARRHHKEPHCDFFI